MRVSRILRTSGPHKVTRNRALHQHGPAKYGTSLKKERCSEPGRNTERIFQGPSGPNKSEPPLPSKSTIALGRSRRLSIAVSTLAGPPAPSSQTALKLAEKPAHSEPVSTLTKSRSGFPGNASLDTLRRASRSSQAPSCSGCSVRKRACSAAYAGSARNAFSNAAPTSAEAGSGAAIGGAGRFGSTASSAPLHGAENSATNVRPPTAESRQISLAMVSAGIAGPSAQPSQNSAVRGSGETSARNAKRCKRVSHTAPVAPSTFTGRPSQARSALGKRARTTPRVALVLSPARVIGPSAQARSGLASSSALFSSASQSPGWFWSGDKATLDGAAFSAESAIGAGHAELHALAGAAGGLALAAVATCWSSCALGPSAALSVAAARTATLGAGSCEDAECVRHATALANHSAALSAGHARDSGFGVGIAFNHFTAQETLERGLVDHARAELLSGVSLGFAHLFTDH